MATKNTTIAAEIQINTKYSGKTLKELKSELKDLKDNLENAEFGSEEFKRLNKEIDDLQGHLNGTTKAAAGSVKELKELKKQLKETAAGSEEFKKLSAQIRDVEDGLENAKAGANDFAGALENADGPVGMFGKGLRQLEIATSSWGAALKATGIGLLVGLVGGLAAAFAKNEGAMKRLEPITTQFGRILNGVLRTMEPLLNAFLTLAEQALPYVSKGFEVAYSALSSFLQGVGLVGSAVKKFISGDFSGAWDDAKKSVTEFGKRYEDANKRFISGTKELTDTEKAEQAKRLADQKAAAEKAEQIRKEAEQKRRQEVLDKEKWDLQRKEYQLGVDKEIKESGDQIIADAAKADAEREAKAKKDREDALKYRTQLTIDNYKREKDLKDLDKANDDKLAKAKIDNVRAIGNATEALGAIIGQQTTAGKALGIATALINTYIGASEVIRAKSVLPEPFGTIQKIASVAGIIATGIKSVKAIMGVQVPGVKGASGGGGSMPSIPNMNVSAPLMAQASTTTLNQAQVNQIGNVAARAFVIESDVSGNQERIQRLNRAARIN
jgi:hypothetical protein